jgi:hypothetical protein
MDPDNENVNVVRWSIFKLQRLMVTKLTKCKNDGGCQHFKNAPAPCFLYLPNEKIQVLFFLSPRKVRST